MGVEKSGGIGDGNGGGGGGGVSCFIVLTS